MVTQRPEPTRRQADIHPSFTRTDLLLIGLLLAGLLLSGCKGAAARPSSTPPPTDPPTRTLAPTETSTRTATRTATPRPSSTRTASPTATRTPTITATPLPTATFTPIQTATNTPYPSLAISELPLESLPPYLQTLKIAYNDGFDLVYWENGKSTPVWNATDIFYFLISSDGKVIAYQDQQGLWSIQSDGSNHYFLVNNQELSAKEPDADGVWVSWFDWVPGTHKIHFTTAAYKEGRTPWVNSGLLELEVEYPGTRKVSPRWEVATGRFSPDGQKVAFTTTNSVEVCDANGKRCKVLMDFQEIGTYSEYTYAPGLEWTSDSQALLVPIPSPDVANEPNPKITLWYIPIDGKTPRQITQIPDEIEGYNRDSIRFSPVTKTMAYALKKACPDPNNEFELHFFRMDNYQDKVFGCISSQQISWSPDGKHFLFWKGPGGVLHLGDLDGNAVSIPGLTHYGEWIDKNHFFAEINGQYYIQSLDGSRYPLNFSTEGRISFTK